MMIRKLHLGANPIIVKELRSRMRGVRAFATLTGVLLALGGMSYVLFQMVMANARYSNMPISPQIGQGLFAGLALLELIMVCGITPSVTAGAISSEQEKLTYEMLLATPLRPASILWGKLVSSLSYVFLLLFAAIPLASLVFIFGGVAPRDMLKALLVVLVVMVMFGVLGLFMSALFGRTGRATVLSYLVVLLMLFGPLFISIAYGVLRQTEPPRWLLVPSPINALTSALTPSVNMGNLGSLFMMFGGNFWMFGERPVSLTSIPRPLYHYSLPLYGLITLVLYLLSTRLILPAHRWRIGWRNALLGLGILGLYLGAVAGAYMATADRYEKAGIFNNPGQPDIIPPPQGFAMPAVVEPAVEVVEVVEVAPNEQPPTPTPLPAPGAAVPEGLAEADQVSIYTALVLDLMREDRWADGHAPYPIQFYLVSLTDDRVGGTNATQGEPITLPEDLQKAILKNLADQPVDLRWSDHVDSIPVDDPGVVGLILGILHPQPDGTVLVPAALRFADGWTEGATYVFSQKDGDWYLTGMMSDG